jgi:CheY-like chemotaxis protein
MEVKGPHVRVGRSLCVLIVEDDDDTATSLTTLLQTYGNDVGVAIDGPSACQAVQASQPDVVLLDIGLPKMDGWDVAKRIREQSIWKRPLLVAMTGYGEDTDRLRSEEAGIDLRGISPRPPSSMGSGKVFAVCTAVADGANSSRT